ncbi:hypothetical protein C8J25_103358 [Sphingomonas faeni]|uniref:Uncharacterized protein n=1 Tax=Sphingomonas faeni TaxID=185950 RepID=A0A2T5U805_9SPHN|nr:hypothetical protein [Sphingomonas faeni]PTW47637.1 hypothetical protein C8J25_103358 [Sphingomonas faeni]
MVLLPDSFHAFAYQSGVDSIRDAFQASITTLREAERKAGAEYLNYMQSGEDDDEYDEDGCLTHSTLHSLAHAEIQVGYAAREVRKAFITSAFHYWERSARSWTGMFEPKHGFDVLLEASAEKHPISPDLVMLNHLNNVLKHHSIRSAPKLADIRTDHFYRPPYRDTPDGPLMWTMRINTGHVEEAIEIVRASGPQVS